MNSKLNSFIDFMHQECNIQRVLYLINLIALEFHTCQWPPNVNILIKMSTNFYSQYVENSLPTYFNQPKGIHIINKNQLL